MPLFPARDRSISAGAATEAAALAGQPLARIRPGERSLGSAPAPACLQDHPDAIVREAASLGRRGTLEVRLAATAGEVRRAQRLRYAVFYDEMGAAPSGAALLSRQDRDGFDRLCDHLIVIDHAVPSTALGTLKPTLAATCRLLRQEVAERHGGFYSAGEYAIAPLLQAHPQLRFVELGRSCVARSHRNRRAVELLWHGIWAYVRRHRIDAMIGCASLEGTDPDRLALPLSFLHHFASAPQPWRARALPGRHVAMDRLPKAAIDPRAALQALPPLIKGYLRLGAGFGDGAVIDHAFGTTDVFVALPVAAIRRRYIDHFGPAPGRGAAARSTPEAQPDMVPSPAA